MNKDKKLDFDNKLVEYYSIARKLDWELNHFNNKTGQIDFVKDKTHLHLYTTKMTVMVKKDKYTRSYRDLTDCEVLAILKAPFDNKVIPSTQLNRRNRNNYKARYVAEKTAYYKNVLNGNPI